MANTGQMSRKKEVQQASLFVEPDLSYGWKSVQQVVARQELIVIADQEVKVLGVRQEGSNWYVSYSDPSTGRKVEQLYYAHDHVYARQQTKRK